MGLLNKLIKIQQEQQHQQQPGTETKKKNSRPGLLNRAEKVLDITDKPDSSKKKT